MNAIKNVGIVILGFAAFAASLCLLVFLLRGAAFISGKMLPYVSLASFFVVLLCLFLFLLLSLFRTTRTVAIFGFFTASYIFGLAVWMYGFLVTYDFWGGIGILIGLFLGGVGVVPLGIIAAALHGSWYDIAELVFGIALTFGARIFAIYLLSTLEARVSA